MANSVVAVIMAGGQGSRLYPLTKIRSKPAVPIAGRFRLIDVPISNCIHSGYRRIFVLTQFASHSLHRHILVTYRFDAFHPDFVTLLSAQQTLDNRDWYQGTADAVRQNLNYIMDVGDIILVLAGDHLYRMDYRKFVDHHIKSGAEITIAGTPVAEAQVPDFGVMKVDPSGLIVEFAEKPKDPGVIASLRVPESAFASFGLEPAGRTHLASTGIYVFNRDVLKQILGTGEYEDFGRQVIPEAIRSRKVVSYFFDGYWEDIGTIPAFFEANLNLTEPLPKFNFYDEERPIFTHARFLPGSKILQSDVHGSILCEGSIINRSAIRQSIVGIRSRIAEGCVLDRTVVMGADYFESAEEKARNEAKGIPPIGIGRDSEIRNAIIDKNARIGQGVRLINARGLRDEQTDSCCVVNGILVVPKNAVIPDGTVL
ncbi:MAG: glucose-1-phosphate adenylyltransferase [Candidatus Aminicenantes bacterium]|nr:glucose-1-phosphate adenylyltransferase [Candidatus Aminicenantes bacterium]